MLWMVVFLKPIVSKVVKEEEDAFLKTVDKGLTMLNQASKNISGEEAFKLYDTFGFPLDLTKLVAEGFALISRERLSGK